MHKEYKRLAEDASVGLIIIHGITSSPNHFRDFIELIPHHFSVHALLLEGHGKEAKDFSKASMKKWETQVAQAIEDMAKNHSQIYLVAHSMGTLLSIEQSLKNPKISRMFLLNSPLRVFVKPRMIPIALKISGGKSDSASPVLSGFAQSYSIAPEKNILRYTGWIPRFTELLLKSINISRKLDQIKCPTLFFQSQKDELVSIASCHCLKNNPNIAFTILPNSGHCYYAPEDLATMQKAFVEFLS